MKVGLRIAVLMATMAGLAQGACVWSQAGPQQLTLREAIERGVRVNLAVLLADARTDEAQGSFERRRAAAQLPRVNAQTYVNVQNRNLRAFGISAPGLPEVVGPFANEYVGVSAQQTVFDLAALRTMRASAAAIDIARLDETDARDSIVRMVAALYLNAQSAEARAASAQTRVNDARVLEKLAEDRHDAGVATGVDVLRAQVALANERQILVVVQNQKRQALLTLAKNIGLEPGTEIELAEKLARDTEAPSREDAAQLLAKALELRADYKSLDKQREMLNLQLAANHARYYPKISVGGNIGGLGRSLGGMKAVGSVQGQVDFTLFDRDRDGESSELSARLRRVQAQIDDLRRGISEQVRSAMLDLDSAEAQIAIAEEGSKLAHRELEQARDRFEAGATNNIEVVTAQDAVARAQENEVLALSRQADARFALTRALGLGKF